MTAVNEVKHNHITRNLRPIGKCPACDMTHKMESESQEEVDYLGLIKRGNTFVMQTSDAFEVLSHNEKQSVLDAAIITFKKLKDHLNTEPGT